MIEVSSIDAIPGESEILTLMANYMTERLFTKRQRRSLTVFIDVTRESVREPVTRRMLGPQKAGLGTRAPTNFEMTVSTGAGLRDAAEVIAHELLHISQAVNGRLLITEKTKKINGVKKKVDLARWMGGKPIRMDELAWHQRPWEIEACGWQGQLVTEFLMLTTGQSVDQPVQSPKRKQLALYPVSVPAPMSPVHQEPVFAPGNGVGEAAAVEPRPKAPGSVVEENGASIDALIDGKIPLAAQPVAVAAGAALWLPAVCSIMVMMAVPRFWLISTPNSDVIRSLPPCRAMQKWMIRLLMMILPALLPRWISSLFGPTTRMLPRTRLIICPNCRQHGGLRPCLTRRSTASP